MRKIIIMILKQLFSFDYAQLNINILLSNLNDIISLNLKVQVVNSS